VENDSKAKEQDKKQQQRILESFQSGTFEEIVASRLNKYLYLSTKKHGNYVKNLVI